MNILKEKKNLKIGTATPASFLSIYQEILFLFKRKSSSVHPVFFGRPLLQT